MTAPPAPEHPTDFLLDRHALGEVLPDVAAHVAQCERCAAHVREATAEPGPIPLDLVRRTRARWRPRLLAAGIALAAAAALMLFVAPRDPVRSKGAPAVQLWTQTDAGTQRWAGEALSPGDRVRLWVDPGPHRRIEVRSGGATLYTGDVGIPGPLPVSWTLDVGGDNALEVWLTGGDAEPRRLLVDVPVAR